VPAAQPGHWLGPMTRLGWLGLAQPILVGLDPTPPTKESGPDLGFRPSQPKLCLCFDYNFYAHFSMIFGQTSPFSISKEIKK